MAIIVILMLLEFIVTISNPKFYAFCMIPFFRAVVPVSAGATESLVVTDSGQRGRRLAFPVRMAQMAGHALSDGFVVAHDADMLWFRAKYWKGFMRRSSLKDSCRGRVFLREDGYHVEVGALNSIFLTFPLFAAVAFGGSMFVPTPLVVALAAAVLLIPLAVTVAFSRSLGTSIVAALKLAIDDAALRP
jgi:hypothetical protein